MNRKRQVRYVKNTKTGNIKTFDDTNKHILKVENMVECNEKGTPLNVLTEMKKYNTSEVPVTDGFVEDADDEAEYPEDDTEDAIDRDEIVRTLKLSSKSELVQLLESRGVKVAASNVNNKNKNWFIDKIIETDYGI